MIGVNFIFYFGTSYFQNSGIKNPFIISVITDVVNVSSTVPGLYLVEKWGRRPLLMFGAIGTKRHIDQEKPHTTADSEFIRHVRLTINCGNCRHSSQQRDFE